MVGLFGRFDHKFKFRTGGGRVVSFVSYPYPAFVSSDGCSEPIVIAVDHLCANIGSQSVNRIPVDFDGSSLWLNGVFLWRSYRNIFREYLGLSDWFAVRDSLFLDGSFNVEFIRRRMAPIIGTYVERIVSVIEVWSELKERSLRTFELLLHEGGLPLNECNARSHFSPHQEAGNHVQQCTHGNQCSKCESEKFQFGSRWEGSMYTSAGFLADYSSTDNKAIQETGFHLLRRCLCLGLALAIGGIDFFFFVAPLVFVHNIRRLDLYFLYCIIGFVLFIALTIAAFLP